MTSLSPIAASLSTARLAATARPALAQAAVTSAAPVAAASPAKAAVAVRDDAGSTGSLIRTASDQLDQFDRVMEKLRSSMAAGAVTYGGAPSIGQGRIIDRLA